MAWGDVSHAENSLLIIFPRSPFRSPVWKRKEGHIWPLA